MRTERWVRMSLVSACTASSSKHLLRLPERRLPSGSIIGLRWDIWSPPKRLEPIAHDPTAVCQIPKTALLSARTSSLPPSVLPFTRPTTSHTIFHLALALLHELRLGSGSRWYGYLQSLPRRTVMLPLFWGIDELGGEDGKEARRWLVGTEAERDLAGKDKEGLALVGV